MRLRCQESNSSEVNSTLSTSNEGFKDCVTKVRSVNQLQMSRDKRADKVPGLMELMFEEINKKQNNK